jgi:hypothetical protein
MTGQKPGPGWRQGTDARWHSPQPQQPQPIPARRPGEPHKKGDKDRRWWPVIAAAIIGAIATVVAALIANGAGALHLFVAPVSTPTVTITPPPAPTVTVPGSAQSSSPPEFLMSLPVASGDTPQKGLLIIGGQSFPKSLYYDNSARVQSSYNTHFSLTGNWKVFVASVGIQPDPADHLSPDGSCSRDAGSTYEVSVDQVQVAEGEVPCGQTQKISVSVAGAHDLDLVFNTHPFWIATGDFVWANAQLK